LLKQSSKIIAGLKGRATGTAIASTLLSLGEGLEFVPGVGTLAGTAFIVIGRALGGLSAAGLADNYSDKLYEKVEGSYKK
jgi:hypothetical protein